MTFLHILEEIPPIMRNAADLKPAYTLFMQDIDADFTGKIAQGDIIVAGDNFGCGSSREHVVREDRNVRRGR